MDWIYYLGQIGSWAPNLIGIFFPPLVAVLNTKITDHRIRFLMAVLVSFIGAGFLHIAQLSQIDSWTDADSFFGILGILFTESQIVYRLYFKDSVLEKKIVEKTEAMAGEPEPVE